ncbi:hypothetical protein C5167_020955 [Papaver somniferum]|uniref:Uncharacterized protein n=1 Tax=Papaver somniferum TaxID=3469 RepID=A0A4Y7IYG3_PAPSO|nr:hypothetical protein C5167_020955 [Papaver somniferum]
MNVAVVLDEGDQTATNVIRKSPNS